MNAPSVSDEAWRDWLAGFPERLPLAIDSPRTFWRRCDVASAAPSPDPGRLTLSERAAVGAWLERYADTLLALGGTDAFAAGLLGAVGSTLGVAGFFVASVPASLIGCAMALYSFADAGFAQANRDAAAVVARKLIAASSRLA